MSERDGASTRAKIKDVEELASILASLRLQKRNVVHCHGVFDVVHIGHIRHFEQAKKLGDVLVVTVTADEHVNKGPHRPAFPEELRAEAIAALDCVDYVATSRWPNAVELIRLLRPNFYVKGPDYKDAAKDHTGGITLEEAAVKSVGGQLVFTDDVTFSASTLINRHLPTFPKEIADYLRGFSARYRTEDVLQYLENARSMHVLLVGEAIIDEYHYCEALGKSSKEPILAVRRLSTEPFAGGILAVANHVASFCDHVGVVTYVGSDCPHEDFVRTTLKPGIDTQLLYRKNSPTIVKKRFIDAYYFAKLFEVYEMDDTLPDEAENASLCAALNREAGEYDAVIVTDFGHGMLSREAIGILSEKARFLAVNTQSNAASLGYQTVSRYPRADYVCMTETEMRLEFRDRHADLRRVAAEISKRYGGKPVTATRGKKGALCCVGGGEFVEVPAFATQVVDRVGSGDALISLTALCVAQKAPMEIVAFIGNAVGALAVASVGHRRSIERVPLFKYIESLMK